MRVQLERLADAVPVRPVLLFDAIAVCQQVWRLGFQPLVEAGERDVGELGDVRERHTVEQVWLVAEKEFLIT